MYSKITNISQRYLSKQKKKNQQIILGRESYHKMTNYTEWNCRSKETLDISNYSTGNQPDMITTVTYNKDRKITVIYFVNVKKRGATAKNLFLLLFFDTKFLNIT